MQSTTNTSGGAPNLMLKGCKVWVVTEFHDWAVITEVFTSEAEAEEWALRPYLDELIENKEAVEADIEALRMGAFEFHEAVNILDETLPYYLMEGRLVAITPETIR